MDPIFPDVFTVDYTGEPGRRTFFFQARVGMDSYSYLAEKEQVTVLAAKLTELLLAIDPNDPVQGRAPARDPDLAMLEPEPLWRAGSMAIAYDETSERVAVMAEEMVPDDDDEVEGETARFSLDRDQVRAFVLHALAVVQEGRATCPLCGLPMDPSGHVCPASNGHHPRV